MAREISNHVQYYYDFHPTEEDLMGETPLHAAVIHYLMSVLHWLFQGQHGAVYENLNFYQTPNKDEYPLAPDIAIIKGVDYREDIRSWRVGKTGPAPHVVLEIASPETWKKDLQEKPSLYAHMGVQEYFAYDPYQPPIRRATTRRLFGWQLDAKRRAMVEMLPNTQGWLWSEQLESWLVPEGTSLCLYDHEQRLRPTEAQAEALLKEQAAEQAAEQAERAQEARQAAEQAEKRAEEEARRAQALAEKLRSLGINPDEII